MYEPTTGRFSTLDPFFGNLNNPQSFHKYAYVHGDPVNNIDPTGMYTTTELAVAGSIVGGLTAAVLYYYFAPDWNSSTTTTDGQNVATIYYQGMKDYIQKLRTENPALYDAAGLEPIVSKIEGFLNRNPNLEIRMKPGAGGSGRARWDLAANKMYLGEFEVMQAHESASRRAFFHETVHAYLDFQHFWSDYGPREDEGIAYVIEIYHLKEYDTVLMEAWRAKQRGEAWRTGLNQYFTDRANFQDMDVYVQGVASPMTQQDIDRARSEFGFGDADEPAIRRIFGDQ